MTDQLRPISTADLPELFDLHRRVEVHDDIPIVTPWEEFAEIKDEPSTNLDTDTVMVVRDGRAIGYGRMWYRPAEDGDHARAFAIGEIDPLFRRQGVGTRILRWTIDRCTEALRSTAPSIKTVSFAPMPTTSRPMPSPFTSATDSSRLDTSPS